MKWLTTKSNQVGWEGVVFNKSMFMDPDYLSCLHMLINRLWEVVSQCSHRLSQSAQPVIPGFHFLISRTHTGLAFSSHTYQWSFTTVVVCHRWWTLASLSQPFLQNLTPWNGKLSAVSVLEPIAPPTVCWTSASSVVLTGKSIGLKLCLSRLKHKYFSLFHVTHRQDAHPINLQAFSLNFL